MAGNFASTLSASFKEKCSQLMDGLNQQVWFQELKQKWEDIEPEKRFGIQVGALVLVVLFLVLWTFLSLWGVYSLKSEASAKLDAITLLQSSTEEMRRLRELNQAAASGVDAVGPWSGHFQGLASRAQIDPSALTLGVEVPGSSNDSSQEALIELKVKGVNLRKLTQFLNLIETGSRPVKIRNLKIDAHQDLTGYLDAVIAVSGFTLTAK